MAIVERSALVTFSARQMYDLVNAVEEYPDFLNWCVASDVHHSSEDSMEASITVRIGGLKQTFATRNELLAPERIELSLLRGPFRSLGGAWTFRQLGEEGCRIGLHLEFEFANRILSTTFANGFSQVAQRLVTDFTRQAEVRYG